MSENGDQGNGDNEQAKNDQVDADKVSKATKALNILKRLTKTSFSYVIKYRRVLYGLIFLALCGLVIADYLTTTRILSVSSATGIDAHYGKITIKYSRPVERKDSVIGIQKNKDSKKLHFSIEYKDDGRTEIIKLEKPSLYKESYTLLRRALKPDYQILGLFLRDRLIEIETGIEKVHIKEMHPYADSNPSPQVMDNQYSIEFCCEVIGKYKRDVNIPPDEMTYVKTLSPLNGFFRWTSEKVLTFNFTEDSPEYETEYGFEIFPDEFLNKERQIWTDDRVKLSFKTSKYEVYVSDFSLKNEVSWKDRLRIEFSGPMVGATEVRRSKSLEMLPIKVTPKPGGHWYWSNANTLEFIPDKETGWPARKKVIVEIQPEINQIKDRKWRKGQESEKFSFEVLPRQQRIDSFSLRGQEVELDRDLVIEFSRKMIPEEETRVSIKNDSSASNIPFLFEPKIDGEFYWVRPSTLRFRPANLWSELTEFTVKLNPAFNPDTRYEWAGADSFKFKTVENLVQADFFMTPEKKLSGADFFAAKSNYTDFKIARPQDRLWILFDKGLGRFIKPDFDMKTGVVISPPIEGEFKWLSNELLEFKPKAEWKEKIKYKISLKKALLHHPEQHFQKDGDSIEIEFGKSEIHFSSNLRASESEKLAALEPTQTLEFNFNRDMNVGLQVGKKYRMSQLKPGAAGFNISPAADAFVVWKTKRDLIISATSYWPPEKAFTLQFLPGLKPTNDSQYVKGAKVEFKTLKNFLSIASVQPRGTVERKPRFEVKFNRNIKPVGVNNGEIETDQIFSFEPKFSGRWLWADKDRLIFDPEQDLAPSSSYKLNFNPDKLKDKQFTYAKKEPKTFAFNTEPIRIVRSSARFEVDENNVLKQKFFVDFDLSEPVKTDQFKRYFSIWFVKTKKNGTKIDVPLTYKVVARRKNSTGQGVRQFYIESDWVDRPSSDRRIYYKVSKGLPPIAGDLALEMDYQSDFLQEKPKPLRIKRISWKLKDFRHFALLTLNAPVSPSKLKKALRVEDDSGKPVKFDVESPGDGTYYREFRYKLTGSFSAGKDYYFIVSKGLLAADGAFSVEKIERTRRVPSYRQEIKFGLEGSFLSKRDLEKIPVVTTNIEKFKVSIIKVYKNNFRYFLNHRLNRSNISDVGKEIFEKWYPAGKRGQIDNQRIMTHINMTKMFEMNKQGVYVVCVSDSSYGCDESRWFLSTDIGVVARQFGDNLLVWTNSLHTGKPKSGVKVSAIDSWNQSIAEGQTNSSGIVRIKVSPGQRVKQILARDGEDLSFVSLGKHEDSLSEFNTEGISPDTEGLRTFVYSDRGVYRPGEIAHLVAVTRSKNGTLASTRFPMQLKVINPKGKEALIENYELSEEGVYVYDFVVPDDAKTGKWKVQSVYSGPDDEELIGNYGFQVEEFVPNKIKVKLELLSRDLMPGKKLRFKVVAKNLFGPPAAQKVVSGEVKLRANYFKPKGFGNFKFGHEDIQFQRIDHTLIETKLDENGEYIYEYEIPRGVSSPIGLNAHYSATVLDDGGRGVAEYASTPIYLFDQYVGIKKITDGPHLLGKPISFEVVNVDRQGRPIGRDKQSLRISLYELKDVTHYKKNERGYYRYVTEKQKVFLKELEDTRDGNNQLRVLTDRTGKFSLEIVDELSGQESRIAFNVDRQNYSRPSIEITDKVLIRPLKKNVKVGDDLKVEIRTPFAGKLLLTGERGDVLFSRVIDFESSTKVVSIPIKKEYLPNFYVSATIVRAVSKGSRLEPIYARGLHNVMVFDKSHYPSIELSMPNQITPNSELSVAVKIADTNKKDMYLTIAAVDEGILNLTRYEKPNLKDYFYQKQKLGVEHFTMYPMVMPYDPEVKRSIDPSGDAPSRALIKKKRVNPDSTKRFETVALWSGLLKFNESGEANFKFKVPDYNGQLRVVAVAYGDRRFASAEKNVKVKDKLILRPALPRFAATGDRFIIPVTLFNQTGVDKEVDISISTSDHLKLVGSSTTRLTLTNNQESQVSFTADVGTQVGVSEVLVTASAEGVSNFKKINLPIRTPGTFKTLSGGGSVDKNAPVSISFPNEFQKGTRELALVVTSNGMVRFKNSLKYLLRYPHGCLEQTTSKVFPLLYYSDIISEGDRKELTKNRNPRYFVEEGISRIERMQMENGGFQYWPGRSRINNWAHIYASHFLVEAKRKGYKVGEATWNNMVAQLEKIVRKGESSDSDYHYRRYKNVKLYALYVLALAGEKVLPFANRMYDGEYGDLKPHEKARLAHVFALSGKEELGLKIINSLAGVSEYSNPYRDTGGQFSSNVRDLSILLESAAKLIPGTDRIDEWARKLMTMAHYGRWGTTHENALALLAIGKVIAAGELRPKGKVILGDGAEFETSHRLMFKTVDLVKGDARIEVTGKGDLSYAWEAVGIEKDVDGLIRDSKIKVRKRFLNKEGKEVDLKQIAQGDLVVVEIKASSFSGALSNVAIMDLLPTGLEIENSRLASSSTISWVSEQSEADYSDIRDDRITFYTSLFEDDKKFYYTARAVTRGQFSMPPIHAEAMYDPSIVSRSGFGEITIGSKEE